MSLRSFLFLLPCIVLAVYGRRDTKENPVDVLQVSHLLLDFYDGPLKCDTLELFKNVVDLQLRNSNFSPFNISFLLAVPNLRRLQISTNTIQPIYHDVSSCCSNLEVLEFDVIGTSDLGEVEFKMIKAMKSLKRLALQNLRIPILDEDNFLGPNIKQLSIQGANLTTIKKNAFAKLQQLENLDLQWNSLKDIQKEMFAPLKNVKVINLKGNLLERLTINQIPPLPNLEQLIVAYNPIKELNLEGIQKIAPKLESVDVSATEIAPGEVGDVEIINHSYRRVL